MLWNSNKIRLEAKKESILVGWTIRRLSTLPLRVHLPLLDSVGQSLEPCVETGDKVLTGQKIAAAREKNSEDLHASVSGFVKNIGTFSHPVFGEAEAIEIESDGRDEKWPGVGVERIGWENLSGKQLLEIFPACGLTDFGPPSQALHQKILSNGPVKTLIINACESEPYITVSHSLMMSHPMELLKGMEILRKAAGAERVILATENDKREPAEVLKSKIYFLKWNHFEVKILEPGYPQDLESLLMQKIEKDALAFHLSTVFSVYEAVVLQKPFYEKAVTVGGECVIEPRNLWARLGSEFGYLIKSCRGFMREPGKLLMNGPMRGYAQTALDVPVVKTTQAILALPKEITKPREPEPCIRCGRCADACPSALSPAMITLAAERDLFELAGHHGLNRCIECGNCAYVCPSGRPMMELIRYAMEQEIKV